jgi:hypothetical protein
MRHYCDGCNVGSPYDEDHPEDDLCCGGDGECDDMPCEPDCTDPDGHEWTREGCGGCSTNPGVWSLGGTVWEFRQRCRRCGLIEVVTEYGWQRNPGQCDKVRFKFGEPDPEYDEDFEEYEDD